MEDLLGASGPATAAFLVWVSLFTSALTGAFGLGGGLVLIACMTVVLPSSVVVPCHGVVQMGSNGGRALLLFRKVDVRKLIYFVPGAAVGVVVGGSVAIELPTPAFRALVGAFVLWAAWRKPGLPIGRGSLILFVGGVISSFLTMFVGATGPFVVSLFRQSDLEPEPLIATCAVATLVQHALKVVAFGWLGFELGPWMTLVGAMILSGFVGTWLGVRLLKKLPKSAFAKGLRVVLTTVAIGLLIGAAQAVL